MGIAGALKTLAGRVRETVSEAEYARNRMMELRTGYVYTEETRRRRAATEIHNLNALFTDDAVSCSPDGNREPLDAPDEDRRDDRPGLNGS